MIGKQILHYQILTKLGEGGMGVVYKAEDTKLRRTVALKFLPPAWTRDANAKARFMNEARAASALQHNNICTIHEVAETPDGQLFICMDYYEGETIRQKIERGSLTPSEAVSLAMQIAEGLAKAHEKNIVHRDLKPANVLITGDGVAKIVDFGLAKLAGRTMLTKEGTTLGTAAYMSPEQARGKDVDHRTDIFSLGVVLYEMLTGELPFKGEYDQAIIYSILHEEPAVPSQLKPNVLPGTDTIVTRCLEKEPANRYRDVRELLTDFESLDETGRRSADSTQGILPKRTQRRRRATIAAGSVMVAALIAAYYVFSSRNPPDAPAWSIKPLTGSVVYEGSSTWSPDGSLVAYHKITDNSDIYMMAREGGKPIQLTDSPTDELNPRWSPDGSKIAFISDRGEGTNVYVMPASGGPERKVAETGIPQLERIIAVLFSMGDLPWSPDGKQLLFPRMNSIGEMAIWRVDLETGEEIQLTQPPAGSNDQAASWSFDGESIVFQRDEGGFGSLWLLPASGGEPTPLLEDGNNNTQPTWSSDNRRVVFISNRAGSDNLWDVDVSSGEFRQLTAGSERIYYPNSSATGLLAYSDFSHQVDLYLLDVNSGSDERLTFHKGDNFHAHFAPDGVQLAYRSTRTGDFEIWLLDLESREEINLSDDPAIDIKPDWSPDGRQIVFLSNREGEGFHLWLTNRDGSGLHRLTEDPVPLPSNIWSYSLTVRWAPDDQAIGFIVQEEQGRALWAVDTDGKNPRALLPGTHSFDWWRDSRHVIYNNVATQELRVADLSTGEEAVLYKGLLTEVVVSPDGRWVSFCHAAGHWGLNIYRLNLQLPESLGGLPTASGEPEKLTDGNGVWHAHNGSWAPDGQHLVYSRDEDEGDIYVIENYR